MKFVTSIRSIPLAALLITSAQLFAAEAAKVEFVWGSAFTLSGSGEKRELKKGLGIEVGDTVISEDARVQLRFSDGGLVSLAPHSEFRVNAYSYSGKPDGTERIEMELLKGGLRTISGLIGKAIKTAYEMKTAVATMGIRGTEYTVVYGDSVTGTVSAGAIAVCNAGGCLDVVRGQSYQVMNLDFHFLRIPSTRSVRASLSSCASRSHGGDQEDLPLPAAQDTARACRVNQRPGRFCDAA